MDVCVYSVLYCTVLYFILILYFVPPLWSSGQSSWLQIRRSQVWFQGTTRKKKVVGLERGSHSLVSTTEQLLGRNSSGYGLESREYGRRDSSRWPRGTLYPQRVGTNFADKRQSLGRIVRLKIEATEFVCYCILYCKTVVKVFHGQ
jgi:hypothetical protein